MFKTAQIRGYRANLQGAVNVCENGATVELDLKTARILIEICRQAENYQDAVSISRASQGSGATEEDRLRVARALFDLREDDDADWGSAECREVHLIEADAAIAALSPPTTPQAPEDVRADIATVEFEVARAIVRVAGAEVRAFTFANRGEKALALAMEINRAFGAHAPTPVTVTMEECRQIAHSVYANNTQQLAEALRRVLPGRIQIAGEPS